ncbi:COX15/CtaA family protein [Sulfidibacter corallicola]|uniref:COX15/CtaA family protein n=1 Tax=Sulfidibacter corallicola TaxID=2818388 RepID=A0A8A4TEV6_SULCO|nr:COX15/CtaA family protein [Sulfidibacter corallicola]QTD48070.1 COX15/CtaA family protein [Sulfidibacter corallicola]
MNLVVEAGRKPVIIWLYTICGMIFCMIALGGLTRLTDSGLSMVQWKVIMGAIPPLSHDDWIQVFDQYKQYPQYLKQNQGMSLDEFKFIFYMEYFHRLLGRLIGVAFFFPVVYFQVKGWLRPKMLAHCCAVFALGGLQGLVGWFMVRSGLVDLPRVSHYRLVLHLSLAMLVFTYALYLAFTLRIIRRPKLDDGVFEALKWPGMAALALVACQIASGGFVAGLRAGHAYNTFPTMNGQWFPAALWSFDPWISNFFENPVMVQFVHRYLALAVTVVIIALYFRFANKFSMSYMRIAFNLLLACLVLQVTLGISTLLLRVPVSLGSLHQIGAVCLWAVLVFICQQAWTQRV